MGAFSHLGPPSFLLLENQAGVGARSRAPEPSLSREQEAALNRSSGEAPKQRRALRCARYPHHCWSTVEAVKEESPGNSLKHKQCHWEADGSTCGWSCRGLQRLGHFLHPEAGRVAAPRLQALRNPPLQTALLPLLPPRCGLPRLPELPPLRHRCPCFFSPLPTCSPPPAQIACSVAGPHCSLSGCALHRLRRAPRVVQDTSHTPVPHGPEYKEHGETYKVSNPCFSLCSPLKPPLWDLVLLDLSTFCSFCWNSSHLPPLCGYFPFALQSSVSSRLSLPHPVLWAPPPGRRPGLLLLL